MDLAPLVPEVLSHAEREAPDECCGLAVVRHGNVVPSYWPARNTAPRGHFVIHPDDQAAAEDAGILVGVCHSHVGRPPLPSPADRTGCRLSGVPWLIVGWPTRTHHQIEPDPIREPLIGRPFVHGVLDCYTLIRDYYHGMGIEIPDYARADDWWLHGGDLYREHFAEAGFIEADPATLRAHDVVLMQVGSPVPNHAGVIDAHDHLLHHCQGRLSCRVVYGGYWRRVTRLVLRHQELV